MKKEKNIMTPVMGDIKLNSNEIIENFETLNSIIMHNYNDIVKTALRNKDKLLLTKTCNGNYIINYNDIIIRKVDGIVKVNNIETDNSNELNLLTDDDIYDIICLINDFAIWASIPIKSKFIIKILE